MLYLRVVLFLGLVVHKLVWEALKKGSPEAAKARKPFELSLKQMVKLAKALFLVFLVIQTLFLDVFPLFSQPGVVRAVGVVVYVAGLAIALAGRLQLGRNWANIEDYQVLPQQQLVRSGIYKYIRHPIYTGDILLILGLELALNSWLVLLVLPLALVIVKQASEEEAILAESFHGYRDYQKQTKRFIPFVV